jgi:CrcB protein
MRLLLLVGAGGCVGSMLRYAVAAALLRARVTPGFPFATLAVNVAGCLGLGLALGVLEARGGLSPAMRAFLIVGVLGGFTTFSAFGGETFHLLRTGQATTAFASIVLQLALGIGAVALGHALMRNL